MNLCLHEQLYAVRHGMSCLGNGVGSHPACMPCVCAGTLLGGGGAMGSGGAIAQFVPDAAQRQRLFESVAYDCHINQQPSEAIEMFMAAQKPRAALKIINQQLSAAIHAQQGRHSINAHALHDVWGCGQLLSQKYCGD